MINPLKAINPEKVNRREFHDMALYLQGMADALQNENLYTAAQMLKDASKNICAQGYYGCSAGADCASDHK